MNLPLHLYYQASRPLRWWNGRRAAAEQRSPVAVLCFHRIADDRANSWTISNRTFVRQISWLREHFDLISLEEAQWRIRTANRRPAVSITFDDGYADNCRHAMPLLIEQRIPCTYFVVARNVLEGVPFPHDLAQGSILATNSLEQLKDMAAAGIEIGSHGKTHADLGSIADRDEIRFELHSSLVDLQTALGRAVRYFAFPFGHRENLNVAAFSVAAEAGYEAVCSAYGGFNFPGDDAFHLQRIAVGDDLIHLKNWTTVDPRKLNTPRFTYNLEEAAPCSAIAIS
jgi:peptidoglycan/xylan/chitin deacetylase (PgdA/CDA1 family)